ncbi:helical backbone metal receptor [Candidatus Uabimicrobium sp. HlEnr_7]|uniref:helical backbone metal receptor n=1 Tax=Candidatus Uabimicrobium helgolandensis TaxID=3095367 RepID=UPI003556B3BC
MTRIISMVPSWTETLLHAGVEVVGRTRFCLHPDDKVKSIPIVGGTKSISWEKTKDLKANFLLLDREENTLEMAEKSILKNLVSHICEIKDIAPFLTTLSQHLQNEKLLDYSKRWHKIAQQNTPKQPLDKIPGIKEWITPLKKTCQQFVYLIWRDPWMCVSKNTFIGSVFNHLGFSDYHWSNNEKYPQIDIESFDRETTLLLCSTEPFPFHRKKDDLKQLGFSCAIIDGEPYSWFGQRSLLFLESKI